MREELPEDLKVIMGKVANLLEDALEDASGRRIGFALMVFDFGEGGTMSFVSNSQRAGLINVLKEMAENLEKEVN